MFKKGETIELKVPTAKDAEEWFKKYCTVEKDLTENEEEIISNTIVLGFLAVLILEKIPSAKEYIKHITKDNK